MTVRDLINKLGLLIDADPSVADLQVDSEGCDCIDPAIDVRVYSERLTPRGHASGAVAERRVLVARSLPK